MESSPVKSVMLNMPEKESWSCRGLSVSPAASLHALFGDV